MIRVTVDTEDEFAALQDRELFFERLPFDYQVGYASGKSPKPEDALTSKGTQIGFGRTTNPSDCGAPYET
jgi:hypothetical protein